MSQQTIDKLRTARAEMRSLRARIADLEQMGRDAAAAFRRYEALHTAKAVGPVPAGVNAEEYRDDCWRKARANDDLATKIELIVDDPTPRDSAVCWDSPDAPRTGRAEEGPQLHSKPRRVE